MHKFGIRNSTARGAATPTAPLRHAAASRRTQHARARTRAIAITSTLNPQRTKIRSAAPSLMFRSRTTVHRVDVRSEPPTSRCPASSGVPVADVVVAALALLNGDTQQTAEPLVELLEQHGIAWAWQLRRLTAGELSALAIDEAGWNMGAVSYTHLTLPTKRIV